MDFLQERMAHYLTCDPHLFIAEERWHQAHTAGWFRQPHASIPH
jgi:hypothetical protein